MVWRIVYDILDLTPVICLHISVFYWTHRKNYTVTASPGQSGPDNNGNEEILHIPQISKAGASPLEEI